MKTKIYKELKGKTINHEDMHIPMVVGNRHYAAILAEVEAGEAEIIAYDSTEDDLTEATSAARSWRNSELDSADLDLNREQDGMTSYTVSAIREWRVTLRNWPETDSFPTNKPVKPY